MTSDDDWFKKIEALRDKAKAALADPAQRKRMARAMGMVAGSVLPEEEIDTETAPASEFEGEFREGFQEGKTLRLLGDLLITGAAKAAKKEEKP